MRLLSLMVFLMGAFLMQPVFAAPQLETREYDGRNVLNPPNGFVWNHSECLKVQNIVLDALIQAASDVRVQCVLGNVYYNGATYERVWSLKGTFKVWVE